VLETSTALARELAQKSVNAFAACKQLLNDAFDTSLETQLERERAALSACAEHAEGAEGLQAFTEKRKPDFSRRAARS
jgi:2-(1,2-epoxy-1,2-dihydrophenyl)acetyl-CoA isomerase